MTVRGVDISKFQGVQVPFGELKVLGVTFAIMRCHHGNEEKKDSTFADNVRRARDYGLNVGAYFVPFPLPHLKPRDQVNLWGTSALVDGELVGTMVGDMPPWLDLEWPPPEEWAKWKCSAQQIMDWAFGCLYEMDRDWGITTGVYGYPYFFSALSKAIDWHDMANRRLWIAGGPQYKNGNGKVPDLSKERPPRTNIWGDEWCIWQHDGDGGAKLPNGVDADFNVFNGTADEFATLCGENPDDNSATVAGPVPLPIEAIREANAALLLAENLRNYRLTRDG